MNGAHVNARDYHIYHHTTEAARAAIQESGLFKAGNGTFGQAHYFTTKTDPEEVKIAVRGPNLPNEAVAHHVRIDTDDLDRLNIKYRDVGNGTVVVEAGPHLDLKALNGTWKETNFGSSAAEMTRIMDDHYL